MSIPKDIPALVADCIAIQNRGCDRVAFLHAEEVMDGAAKSEFSGGPWSLTHDARRDEAGFRQNEFAQLQLDPGQLEIA